MLIGEFDLRSTTAELVRVMRRRFPDAHRRPAGHTLHTVRNLVIRTRAIHLGHLQAHNLLDLWVPRDACGELFTNRRYSMT